ncbi:MAG: hypothetical protein ICV60_23575, partial [Pyrinomonadaceae bacterium]|nr:hypothetical protein [Pyrinomonadaceae bacterium]
MRWIKKGLVYAPRGQYAWNQSHAQLPIVDVLDDERWRIYFATRSAANQSNVSYVEVEAGRPENILYEHDRTLLQTGRLGTFDESGIMPVSLVNHAGRKYLYYAGWSVKATVPYHNSIGLAVSEDGGRTFEKFAEGPLFDLRPKEPFFTGTANVLVEDGVWKIWYQSCTGWEMIDGKPEPFYHIKYAESEDGINWKREGRVAIDYKSEREGGICSASVLKEDGIYKMWYCYRLGDDYRHNRANSYRIGYAESLNGFEWTRYDERAGIDVYEEGLDSEMVEYPFVHVHNN